MSEYNVETKMCDNFQFTVNILILEIIYSRIKRV